MPIKVNILSAFDDKGIKQAQSQFGQLGKSLKATIGAVGLGIGLAAITSGLKDAAKAASDDAKSQLLLAQQMKNSTGATDEQIAATESMISKLSIMSAVADDQIRPALSSLVRATGDVTQAQGLLALSLDVSAATGKDLNSVSLAIGKAVSGQTTALFRMIPGLKGSSDWMAKLKTETQGAAEVAGNADPFMRLQIIFDEIQEQIGAALLPALKEVADFLGSDAGQKEIAGLVAMFQDLAKAAGEAIIFLKDNYKWMLEIGKVAAGLFVISKIFGGIQIAITGASAAMAIFNGTLKLNPILLAITAIAALALAIKGLYDISTTGTQQELKGVPEAVSTAARNAGIKAYEKHMKDTGNDIQGAIEAKRKATAGIMAAYRREAGQAKNFITEADPMADLKDLLAGLDTPQVTTPKGASPVAKAVDTTKTAVEEARKAFDDLKQAVLDFNSSFAKTADAFQAVFKFSQPLGEFEQQAVDAFQTMKDAAEDAFADGLIDDKALANLKAYADRESALLVGIAKQRDQLAKKISIAQSVTSGVMGSLDINSMLQSETKTVAKSVTSIVNGIALTTTQSFDEVVTGGLAASFKKLVDKTKSFAGNLVKLKQLGLNGSLFKQIVEGGADAGGATAEAIIAGGADAVKELNGLFGELEKAGSDIAATSTPVLYALGEDITNSFIDGLRSQDQVLIAQAQALASLFTTQFQTSLSSAMAPTISASANLAGMGIDQTDFIPGYGRVNSYGSGVNGGAITNNITVQAGVIASKQELPSIIVDALNTAAKQGLSTRIINAI